MTKNDTILCRHVYIYMESVRKWRSGVRSYKIEQLISRAESYFIRSLGDEDERWRDAIENYLYDTNFSQSRDGDCFLPSPKNPIYKEESIFGFQCPIHVHHGTTDSVPGPGIGVAWYSVPEIEEEYSVYDVVRWTADDPQAVIDRLRKYYSLRELEATTISNYLPGFYASLYWLPDELTEAMKQYCEDVGKDPEDLIYELEYMYPHLRRDEEWKEACKKLERELNMEY